MRVELVAGAGTLLADGGPRFSARFDATARFLLDPLRERPRGPYVGGGLSARREGGSTDGDLVLLFGVEGRARRGWAPSVEGGVGGGVRIGVVLRRARPGAR